MSKLIIRHLPETDSRFQVLLLDCDSARPVDLDSATGYPVEGCPKDDLMGELRWYLEKFLEYPYSPEVERAESVLAALQCWASSAFEALFGSGKGSLMFESAVSGGLSKLIVQVQSADPRVLSWPWEALYHPSAGPLGLACKMERSLNEHSVRESISAELPQGRVNILMVTSRPYLDDVKYRSVSRTLIEMVEKENLPVKVHILRPPTFQRLREHLLDNPAYYHLLHFDGHGLHAGDGGYLLFEDEAGADDPIQAAEVSALMKSHGIPVVVLNACQSGMFDPSAGAVFTSVATSLLRAGAQSVVAMSYSIYVSAAQYFFSAFYRELFSSGDISEGVRVGRKGMVEGLGRICARGRVDLKDWMVPVLYRQGGGVLSFAASAQSGSSGANHLAAGFSLEYFEGRDEEILQLEREMRSPEAAILIYGLSGIGKTILARGFVEWLARTEGLVDGCAWLDFREVQSAEHALNQLGEMPLGRRFLVLDPEQKIRKLAGFFRDHQFLIVWDGFEVVAEKFSKSECDQLRTFLALMRSGATKVLITSRREEAWMRPERRAVQLLGLKGEECWAFCMKILKDFEIESAQGDRKLIDLVNCLGGHPLAMRMILPELKGRLPGELMDAWVAGFECFDLSPEFAKIYAGIRLVESRLDDNLRPLLIPLALHENIVVGRYLEQMANGVDPEISSVAISDFLQSLASAGLLREAEQSAFEIHPMLLGFLRSSSETIRAAPHPVRDRWLVSFVTFYAEHAEYIALASFKDFRLTIRVQMENFINALSYAEEIGLSDYQVALLQALGYFALKQNDFDAATSYYRKLACFERERGNKEGEAVAYYQLGIAASEQRLLGSAREWTVKALAVAKAYDCEQVMVNCLSELGKIALYDRDLDAAERWFHKSLGCRFERRSESSTASVYHNLGLVAEARQDFEVAEEWYMRALEIKEKLGDLAAASATYLHLGSVSEQRLDFKAARRWNLQALEHFRKQDDLGGLASVYRQLGLICLALKDYAAAEEHHLKSLKYSEALGDSYQVALSYHNLGIVAQMRHRFDTAEHWFQQSLEIANKIGNLYDAARVYHHLGVNAQMQCQYDDAIMWFAKSLEIKEDQRDFHGIAATCMHMGQVAALIGNSEQASQWFLKSIFGSVKVKDEERIRLAVAGFVNFFHQASPALQAELRSLLEAVGMPWLAEF